MVGDAPGFEVQSKRERAAGRGSPMKVHAAAEGGELRVGADTLLQREPAALSPS